MSDIVWGDTIEVNGVRPEWLRQSDNIGLKTSVGWTSDHDGGDPRSSPPLAQWAWTHSDGRPCIIAIRLPADHFAYTAIAKGFVPWGGGDAPPADWDGSPPLALDDGSVRELSSNPMRSCWQRGGVSVDIIGYHRRAEQPAGDTVKIAKMRENEFDRLMRGGGVKNWLVRAGVVIKATPAERIAAETGVALADVEKVLAARGEV